MAEIFHCVSCRWWEKTPDENFEWNSAAIRGWGECQLTEMADDKPTHEPTKAIARDGESYKAILETAPDFGCVQWEANDA